MAAALAVLCGRSLSVSTLRQFASADTSHNSRCNFQRDMHVRMGQLENLEKALAKMEPEELRKARLAAAAAAAVAVAAAAAADTTSTAAPTTGQCRLLEDEEEQGMTLADFERLLPRERARRNPAGILYDHPHLNGLIFSIDDSSFTYFEWGEPDSENDDTPTRWFARVSVPQTCSLCLLTLFARILTCGLIFRQATATRTSGAACSLADPLGQTASRTSASATPCPRSHTTSCSGPCAENTVVPVICLGRLCVS